jgi:formylglycine-generating enzyme required for sulfatase activity
MTGNAWEWCWEWSPAAPNAHRMIRGGAWSYSADYARSASGLNNVYPEYTSFTQGFRCVMTKGK